jgi:myo-inositol 2-dehydrogenase/D-chiro-inositol 1-dehydrogenase
MTLHVGLIGAGVMGADHAHTVQRSIAGARLTAVTDIDSSRAVNLSQELDARPLRSAEELIHDADVDAVIVASHDSAHAEQVLACIEAGKPVLCEKPLAPMVEDCRRIVAKQRGRGLGDLVSVGFMRRFHPGFVAMKDQLGRQSLGAPLLVLGSHRNVRSYSTGGSEGTITNSAVHDIDIVQWLLRSTIVEVSWYAPRPTTVDQSRQDPQLIHLRTADGVLSSIDLFVNAQYGYDVRYEMVCERGAIRLAPGARIVTDHDLVHGHDHPADWRPFFADAYRLELQAWVDAVNHAAPTPLATAEDGLRCALVAEALVQSMHRGETVVVDEDELASPLAQV